MADDAPNIAKKFFFGLMLAIFVVGVGLCKSSWSDQQGRYKPNPLQRAR